MERKCREAAEVDVARGYARVVEKYRRRRFVRRLRRWSAVAAGILLPVAVVLLWPEGREWETARETPVATVIKPGGVKAELVLADGSVRRLRKEDRDSLLAVEEGSIRLREESISYEGRQAPAEARHNTLCVPRGGEYVLTLADSTRVWMNSDSELRYPSRFEGGERRVSVTGEAYFQVAKDESLPFIVEAGGAAVRVTGTEFNVMAYPDDGCVETTLVSGGVDVEANGQTRRVAPGSQAVYDKASGSLDVRAVDLALYTSWKDGLFEFRDMPLGAVARQLERWYDVEILFADPAVADIRFTGAVKKMKPLAFILDIIQGTRSVDYRIEGRQVIIDKK